MVYKDSLARNGTTPFLLKTYGGYGVIAKPSFSPGIISFIENGGAFAYVHIRGGGEFGYKWWQEGRNLKKRNGILDFIHAAEYLIAERYTKPKKNWYYRKLTWRFNYCRCNGSKTRLVWSRRY